MSADPSRSSSPLVKAAALVCTRPSSAGGEEALCGDAGQWQQVGVQHTCRLMLAHRSSMYRLALSLRPAADCHPTPPLKPTRGVDFEVVAVGGVQAQQAAARGGRVHHVAEQVAQHLGLGWWKCDVGWR